MAETTEVKAEVASVTTVNINPYDIPADMFQLNMATKQLCLKDGWSFKSSPEVLYGTGAPPDATNLPDGTLYFRYE